MGDPASYAEMRARFFGDGGGPAAAPASPTPIGEILDEFRARLAGGQMNAQHPRQFGYFTPPPLPVSMMGELLAQMTNQGVDVWHAGPLATFVEEEVVRWLCDLVGFGAGSFGLLTSGGVMANFMGMTLARDIHLGRLLGAGRPPRGAMLDGVRVYTSDQTHFSIAPGARPARVPARDARRHRVRRALPAPRGAGRRGHRARPGRRADPVRDRRRSPGRRTRARWTLVGELADVAAAEDLWLHVDAAYGGAARLSARDAGRVTDLERADSVTVDPHKWFFQAYDIGGLLVRDGRAPRPGLRRSGARVLPRRRNAGRGDPPTTTTRTSSTSTSSASRAPAAGARSSSGCRGSTSAPTGSPVSSRPTTTTPRSSRDCCAESDDFEAVPEVPELSVVCFRHLPGGRAAAARLAARRARRPPGSTPARPRGLRRRLADDDPAARRHLAPRRDPQLPHDRRRHRSPARDAPSPG